MPITLPTGFGTADGAALAAAAGPWPTAAMALGGLAAGIVAFAQRRWRRPVRSERGEGVISAAIAVLIVASLGALMWVGFKALWENAEETTNSEIAKIGR